MGLEFPYYTALFVHYHALPTSLSLLPSLSLSPFLSPQLPVSLRTWWYQVLVLELCLPSGLRRLITEVDLSQTIVSLSTALASAR